MAFACIYGGECTGCQMCREPDYDSGYVCPECENLVYGGGTCECGHDPEEGDIMERIEEEEEWEPDSYPEWRRGE